MGGLARHGVARPKWSGGIGGAAVTRRKPKLAGASASSMGNVAPGNGAPVRQAL